MTLRRVFVVYDRDLRLWLPRCENCGWESEYFVDDFEEAEREAGTHDCCLDREKDSA